MEFSVLISVYEKDSPKHFDDALLSIWDTQSLKPSQLVLVKDGPLPEELEAVVRDWEVRLGPVLTLVELEVNQGLAWALNEGLSFCRFGLVARMDSDDISLPERFERQVAFMEANPGVDVSSAWVDEFDEAMLVHLDVRKVPRGHDEIIRFARRRNPISHPAAIFRKHAVIAVGGYPLFKRSQDYALWSLMLQNGCKMENLQHVVLRMRTGGGLFARRGLAYLKQEVLILRYQRRIGFLSLWDFCINVCARTAIRLQPTPIKRFLYKVAR